MSYLIGMNNIWISVFLKLSKPFSGRKEELRNMLKIYEPNSVGLSSQISFSANHLHFAFAALGLIPHN